MVSNLVRETSTGSGTGNLTLATKSGYVSFYNAYGSGGSNLFYYFIIDVTNNAWEAGSGHIYTDNVSLVRDTVIASSNSNSLVNFVGGTTLQVVNSLPASKTPSTDDVSGGAFTGGPGGSNLILTNTSPRYNVWAASTYGLSVQLPAANTLTSIGGPIFVIKNDGVYSFTVIDDAGNIRWILDAGESVEMFCSNNSSVPGVWSAGNILGTANDLFNINNQTTTVHTVAGATGSKTMAFCPLTSTTGFMIYYDATATAGWWGVVVTVSGESISFGTRTSLQAQSDTLAFCSCVALTSTQVLVSMCSNASDTYVQAVSISGTTVTANTSLVVEAAQSEQHHLFQISSSTAFFGYYKNSGTKNAGVVISVSGTTCSAGTITYGAATITAAIGNLTIAPLIAGSSYLYAYNGTSAYLAAQVFTVSGSSVTANAANINLSNSVVGGVLTSAALSATCVVVSSVTAGSIYTLNINSTTVTLLTGYYLGVQDVFGVVAINPSSVIITGFAQNSAAFWIVAQAGLKIDPINGDLTTEFVKYTGVRAGTTGLTYYGSIIGTVGGGYPQVGPITTLSGKYAVATMSFPSSVYKPQLTYMNVVPM